MTMANGAVSCGGTHCVVHFAIVRMHGWKFLSANFSDFHSSMRGGNFCGRRSSSGSVCLWF